MMLQHARVLAQKYAVDKLQEKMKATDEEVARISRAILNSILTKESRQGRGSSQACARR
jgi:hypothetical protein